MVSMIEIAFFLFFSLTRFIRLLLAVIFMLQGQVSTSLVKQQKIHVSSIGFYASVKIFGEQKGK